MDNEPVPKLRLWLWLWLWLWHICIDLGLKSTFLAPATGASGDPG